MRLIFFSMLATATALPTLLQNSMIASNTPVREPAGVLSSWFQRLIFSKQEITMHSPCFCASGSLYCRDESGELETKGICGL